MNLFQGFFKFTKNRMFPIFTFKCKNAILIYFYIAIFISQIIIDGIIKKDDLYELEKIKDNLKIDVNKYPKFILW